LNIDVQATEKLLLTAGCTYSHAEDSWDWDFDERQSLSMGGGAYNYDSWDQNNEMDSYSDLTYEQYQFTVGGTYNFTETFYSTMSGTYDKFNSKEEYVYGDEDGDAYYGYAGIGWNF